MGCIYRPRCNQVWSVWYCVLVLLLQAYLLYLAVRRYEAYADWDWPPGANVQPFLVAYAGLHVAVIALTPLFIAFALFKTGNLASDNEAFGHRFERTLEIRGPSCCSTKLKSMWMHGPPAAQTVHLIQAFCLLMAQQIMVAKLYKEGSLNTQDIYSTELDFLFYPGRDLAALLPMEPRGLGESPFRRGSYSALHLSPKLLPVLVNHKLFGISLEFVNYLLALLAFAFVYPAVLWQSSKWFAFLFSGQLMLHAVTAVLSYIDFSILFRLHLVGDRLYPYVNSNLQEAFMLPNEWCVLGSYLLSCTAMFAASAVLYGYGYTRYCLSWQAAAQQRLRTELRAQVSQGGNGILRRDSSEIPSRVGCCEGYCPHLFAILLLLLLAASKILLLYDTMLIFLSDWPHWLSLSCVSGDVAYLFSWILLWLALTCKRRWHFKVRHSVPELLTLLQTDWAPSSAWAKYKRRPGDPDSALLVLAGDELYVTDDPQQKTLLLRTAMRNGATGSSPKEDVYWLRPAGASGSSPRTPGSPVQREPLASRLLSARQEPLYGHHRGDYAVYAPAEQGLGGLPSKPPRAAGQSQLLLRRDSAGSKGNPYGRFEGNYDEQQRAQEIANTFGTLPRGSGKHRRQLLGEEFGAQPRSRGGSEVGGAYASIHKAARPSPTPSALLPANRDLAGEDSRGSSYANIPKNGRQANPGYGRWAEPARPPQARVLGVGYPVERNPASVSVEFANFGHDSGLNCSSQQSTPQSSRAYLGSAGPQRRLQQATYATLGGDPYGRLIRASPTAARALRIPQAPGNGDVYADFKAGQSGVGSASRELTPLSTASSATLTRSNQGPGWAGEEGGVAATAAYGHFTPSSTLTSQASYPSQTTAAATPTPGSPLDSPHASSSAYPPPPSSTQAAPARYAKPPQHPPVGGSGVSGHGHMHLMPPNGGLYADRNDSANFSLTSSNESDPHNAQYATSIV